MFGITEDLLQGTKWQPVEPPNGAQLKKISVGSVGIWALDTNGRLYVRKEITNVFPEGTHWQYISIDPLVISTITINQNKYFFA